MNEPAVLIDLIPIAVLGLIDGGNRPRLLPVVIGAAGGAVSSPPISPIRASVVDPGMDSAAVAAAPILPGLAVSCIAPGGVVQTGLSITQTLQI